MVAFLLWSITCVGFGFALSVIVITLLQAGGE